MADAKSLWPIKQSSVGVYSGYSEPIYNGRNRYSVYFTASDGCRLAVDYFIPTKDGVETTEPLPVILNMTPYQRVVYGYTIPDFEFGHDVPPGLCEPDDIVYDDIGIEGYLELSRFGYVIVIADVRGCGASFGCRPTTNTRREALDGKELIEWIAQQPWCTGKVGTTGFSYTGATQLEAISCKPKGLVASFVGMTDYDKYDGWIRNGIPRAFGTEPDVDFGTTVEENNRVIDEVTKDTVPVDADPDKILLRQAIADHVQSGKQIPIMRDLKYRDSYLEVSGGEHWRVISISSYKDQVNESGVAIYAMGGNYDVFRRDTLTIYENYTGPKKMTFGPWYHMDCKLDTRWDIEMLRWFDYWLKGIDNGIMEESPVNVRMANYNFKNHTHFGSDTGYNVGHENWPLHEGTRTTWYLSSEKGDTEHDNGSLALSPDTEGFVEHAVDFGMKNRLEHELSNTPGGIDDLGACFTSAPVGTDTEIVGNAMAYIDFSLEDPGYMKEGEYDTDIFVNISDYDPVSGDAFLFTYGQLRASMRKTGECPYDFLGLPWHPAEEKDRQPLELHKRYELEIDIMPTGYVLKKGHCLRVTITNTMQAAYYLGFREYGEDPNVARPVINIYTGGENGSRVILPNIYKY